mgnify:CR=1 FL=1
MEKFAIGALLGSLGGALLVANNYKMQRLVKKGQTEAIEKISSLPTIRWSASLMPTPLKRVLNSSVILISSLES